MSVPATNLQKIGEQAFNKIDKVNSELLTLTYGSLVVQLLQDLKKPEEVNVQLDRMGYNIGLRIVEEFLARSGVGGRPCKDLAETADTLAKVAFKMFLNVNATVAPGIPAQINEKKEFSICFEKNPLSEFAELPEQYIGKLHFSNILCGVIRGALEMLQMKVECKFVHDTLLGDPTNEIKVVLKELLSEEKPPEMD